jgi:hypothetical protein
MLDREAEIITVATQVEIGIAPSMELGGGASGRPEAAAESRTARKPNTFPVGRRAHPKVGGDLAFDRPAADSLSTS